VGCRQLGAKDRNHLTYVLPRSRSAAERLGSNKIEERFPFVDAEPFGVDVRKDIRVRHQATRKTCAEKILIYVRSEQPNVILLAIEEHPVIDRLKLRIFESPRQPRRVGSLTNRSPASLEHPVYLPQRKDGVVNVFEHMIANNEIERLVRKGNFLKINLPDAVGVGSEI